VVVCIIHNYMDTKLIKNQLRLARITVQYSAERLFWEPEVSATLLFMADSKPPSSVAVTVHLK